MKLSKIMHIGRGPEGEIFVKAEIGENGELSISGVIGPLRNGDARGGCGQIGMEFAHRNAADDDKRYTSLIQPKDILFAPGWNADKWLDFLDVWEQWHLNHMRSGTPAQETAIAQWKANGNLYDYTKASEYLQSVGLLDVPTDDYVRASALGGYDKPTYHYGSRWLKTTLPQSVIDFLMSLPDTDITPAWV